MVQRVSGSNLINNAKFPTIFTFLQECANTSLSLFNSDAYLMAPLRDKFTEICLKPVLSRSVLPQEINTTIALSTRQRKKT